MSTQLNTAECTKKGIILNWEKKTIYSPIFCKNFNFVIIFYRIPKSFYNLLKTSKYVPRGIFLVQKFV